MFFAIVFIFLTLFCFTRIAAMTVAYDTVVDAIFLYSMNSISKNTDFDFKKEYDSMLSPYVFLLQFWNWDMWSIIAEENREKIRNFYLVFKNK